MKLLLQILVGWVVLSLFVGVAAGKAIKTYQASSERRERRERPVLRVVPSSGGNPDVTTGSD